MSTITLSRTLREAMSHDERLLVRTPAVRVRATGDEDEPTFTARVMQYDTIDDYDTVFAAGCFSESLRRKLPTFVWGHDWREPLGRFTDFDDGKTWLDMDGRLDDFAAVPRAAQAYAQMKSGTIDEFSVGFVPLEWEIDDPDDFDSPLTFTKCRLDEVSAVLAGAVPGTALLSLRNASATGTHRRLDDALADGDLDRAAGLAFSLLARHGIDAAPPHDPYGRDGRIRWVGNRPVVAR